MQEQFEFQFKFFDKPDFIIVTSCEHQVPVCLLVQWVSGRLWQHEGSGSQQALTFLWLQPGSEDEPLAAVTYSRVPK